MGPVREYEVPRENCRTVDVTRKWTLLIAYDCIDCWLLSVGKASENSNSPVLNWPLENLLSGPDLDSGKPHHTREELRISNVDVRGIVPQ